MFGKRKKLTGPELPDTDRSKELLVEGRRMCSGCFLWFVPTAGESFCSDGCGESWAKRKGRA